MKDKPLTDFGYMLYTRGREDEKREWLSAVRLLKKKQKDKIERLLSTIKKTLDDETWTKEELNELVVVYYGDTDMNIDECFPFAKDSEHSSSEQLEGK